MTMFSSPTLEIDTSNGAQEPRMLLAGWADHLERSMLRAMIDIVSRPGILSFAGGLPAPELFPTTDYAAALAKVLAEDALALQYRTAYQPLKAHIVDLMGQRGVACAEEQVIITTGAQQALNVLSRLLLDPGGEVLIEQVVYSGIQQAVAPRQPEILAVSTDLKTGMDVNAVAELLGAGHRPAFIYVIPDAHNPLGVSLSAAKREKLAALATSYCVPIVEDDPYGFLLFDRPILPPIRALNDEWVFYVGSFSKIIAPALRLGWLVAPEKLLTKLTVIKEAIDLESSALTQRAVSRLMDTGRLPAHMAMLREEYGMRRDAMLQALEQTFPVEARWTVPAGGMFIWVELPAYVDTMRLLDAALEREKVAFVPGDAFSVPNYSARHCMRLSFSNVTPERIVAGITRLSRVVKEYV